MGGPVQLSDAELVARCRQGDAAAWHELVERFLRYVYAIVAGGFRLLPRPPEAWVRAAQELPAARAALDDLVARAEADVRLREEVLADLEGALRREGFEPDRRNVAALRARLGGEPTT